jgi:protein-disulfide isomerase
VSAPGWIASDPGAERRRRTARIALCGLAVTLAAAVPATADPRPAPGHTERVEHHDPTTAPARGPATAPVTVEVFFVPGPNLPTGALRLLQQLQDRHPMRIRLVYRILKSGSALLVPCAALEAHAEGKFFEMMDELGKQRTALKKDDLLELAGKIGVDRQRVALATEFDRASPLNDHYRDVLEANQRRFERLHAGNTPSVLFNAKPPKGSLGALGAADLDREYEAAYDRAIDKLDRGFAAARLGEAFDDEAMSGIQPLVASAATPDDDTDRSPFDHPLARPPLRLDGLPSFGKPGVAAAVPIVVLCRPSDAACSNLLRVVEPQMRLYPDDVRIVWAPWFDVVRDDAADLTLLGDAALCAEAIGSNQGELTTSPGWVWVREMYAQSGRSHGKKVTADQLIDAVAAKLDVDGRALAACRARMASSTLEWIAAARHSGVVRTSTAIVIGGRIYDGLTDQALIQALVEAELAPGVLGSLPRWHTGK